MYVLRCFVKPVIFNDLYIYLRTIDSKKDRLSILIQKKIISRIQNANLHHIGILSFKLIGEAIPEIQLFIKIDI